MKAALPICCLLFAASLPALAQTSTAPPTTKKEKLSYALGMNIGSQLKKGNLDLDMQTLLNGVHDSLAGAPPKMTEEEERTVLTDFGKEMQAKQQAQMEASQASGPKNKQDGEAFLATNKSKPGVQTLPDGLQYKVIKEGTGPMPAASDKVTVKYTGTLIDGKVFDSSDSQPGGTLSFPVSGVIPGWTEALQKMKVGSKWQLFIPSALAYGDRGAGTDIAPGSTLIFDVELVGVGGSGQ